MQNNIVFEISITNKYFGYFFPNEPIVFITLVIYYIYGYYILINNSIYSKPTYYDTCTLKYVQSENVLYDK